MKEETREVIILGVFIVLAVNLYMYPIYSSKLTAYTREAKLEAQIAREAVKQKDREIAGLKEGIRATFSRLVKEMGRR